MVQNLYKQTEVCLLAVQIFIAYLRPNLLGMYGTHKLKPNYPQRIQYMFRYLPERRIKLLLSLIPSQRSAYYLHLALYFRLYEKSISVHPCHSILQYFELCLTNNDRGIFCLPPQSYNINQSYRCETCGVNTFLSRTRNVMSLTYNVTSTNQCAM